FIFFIKSMSAGLLVYLATSIQFSLICMYVLLLVIINILMTMPQWILFQHHLLVRITCLIMAIVINIVNGFLQSPYITLILLLLLGGSQAVFYRLLFKKIDLDRTVAAGDYMIWNMVLLSHITKVQFKRDKQSSFLQKLSFWKRPFK